MRLIADREMFSQKNLEMMDSLNISYVVAAKLKTLPKEVKESILISDEGYSTCLVNDELQWFKEIEHNGRRLVVSFTANRVKKDAAERQRLIERLQKKQKNGKLKLKIKQLTGNRGTSNTYA
ncbi:hypothetical protein MCHI_001492 [Candidatus Magnetoovum chiemensis]|nr:hypothetical protein MCHI_001492 [Candidatus Magnetoovum chiemensis]